MLGESRTTAWLTGIVKSSLVVELLWELTALPGFLLGTRVVQVQGAWLRPRAAERVTSRERMLLHVATLLPMLPFMSAGLLTELSRVRDADGARLESLVRYVRTYRGTRAPDRVEKRELVATYIDARGLPASRLRLLGQQCIAWIPLLFVSGMLMAGWMMQLTAVSMILGAALVGLVAVHAVTLARTPRRGLAEKLSGTMMVPEL